MEPLHHESADIVIDLHDGVLVIGNTGIRRTLRLDRGYPATLRLSAGDGPVLGEGTGQADFSFIGINLCHDRAETRFAEPVVAVDDVAASWREAAHVRVDITIRELVQDVVFVRSYIIHPHLPAIAIETAIRSSVAPNTYWNPRGGLVDGSAGPGSRESCADSLRLAPGLRPERAIEFRGRTDFTDELVVEHPAADAGTMLGNILICTGDGHGLFLLQEAPPSSERRDVEAHDFRISTDGGVHSCGWGIHPGELAPNRRLLGYRHVIGCFAGDGPEAAIRRYLRLRFPRDARRDGAITVNPWGCGRFPALVCERFLIDEVAAAARLGATRYQIDDGWQDGGGLAELTRNNRSIGPGFWEVSATALPRGLEPVIEACRRSGIEPSLWYAPSFNRDYRDWRTAADLLLGLHRRHGIRVFKLDGVKLRSKEAEDNFRCLIGTLRDRSSGAIRFDFDVTNGQRQGYFMLLEHGDIFLENRYVCHAWGLGYHPEKTLRSLWRLSRYVRTETLQIEIPSRAEINHAFYAGRGLGAPDRYPPAYWAAIALVASPLLWLAPSLMADDELAAYQEVLALHRRHRQEFFAGDVCPIGGEPSGSAICGFLTHDHGRGWIVLFRELAAAEAVVIEPPPSCGTGWGVDVVHASAPTTASVGADGRLSIAIASPAAFALLRWGRRS